MANLAGISGSSIRTEINNELLSYDECFKMDLQHYWRVSNKSVATFESTEGWANNSWNSTVGTVANDTTNYKVGSQGISITSPNNGGGGKLSKVMNLSTFNDGSASTTDDYIQFALYITTAEIAKLNTNGILLRFFCETAPTMTSYFSYNIAVANLVNGWNFLNIVKSSFATNGSAAWADVKGLSFTNNGAPISGSPIYTVDAMRMVRKDPSTSAANPFQKLVNNIWTRDFTINNGHWFVGLENNKIICRALSVNDTGVTNTASSLIGQKIYRNFEIMGVFQSNTTSLSRLVWAIDASNRVYATLVAGTLYLSSTINGVNDDTVNASLSAAIGDLFSIKLSKNGRTFTAKVVKNGNNDSPIILTKDISGFEISDGYLGFGERSGIKQSNIVSLGISKLSFTAQAGEAEEAINVTSQIGGKNISDIFESDGVTVKAATSATTCTGNAATASGVVETGTGALTVYKKKIDIGDWNMDSTISAIITHGLDFSKIIDVKVLIRSDVGDTIYIMPMNGIETIVCSSTDVNITRVTAGYFDNTFFDATSFNRGYITIEYTS
jgi:hypothetical protein